MKLCFVLSVFFVIKITLCLSTYAFESLVFQPGLHPVISTTRYIDIWNDLTDNILEGTNITPELFRSEYGDNNLSFEVAVNCEPYVTNVFMINISSEFPAHARQVRERASQGKHICDTDDIREIIVITNYSDRVVVVSLHLFRENAYEAVCLGVLARKNVDEEYSLIYLGLRNRLSPKLKFSKPVYTNKSYRYGFSNPNKSLPRLIYKYTSDKVDIENLP